MTYARIAACGAFLPEHILTNDALAQRVDTSDEWISSRTGIRQRHLVSENENVLTMAKAACQQALLQGRIDPESIDLLICSTSTPVMIFPSTACLLQNELNIKRDIIAFDLSAACGGFLYALDIAEKYIRSGAVTTALVIGTEVCSKMVDWQDRNTCVLFGDGAGAFVVQKSTQPGFEAISLAAQGRYHDLLTWPNQALSTTATSPYLSMSGQEVYKLAVTELTKSAEAILQKMHLQIGDIDWLIPHQANSRIIDAIAKRLNLPAEKIICTLAEHGNTSSASIPLAMTNALECGKIKRGDRILFQAIGAGMVWGSALTVY
jgi:3-oxoacyl-[acyl-carrier-protein] synthase III